MSTTDQPPPSLVALGHIAFPPTTFVADAYPPLALFAVGWYTCFNWTLSVVKEAEGTIFAINLRRKKQEKVRVRNLFAWNFFGTGTLVKYPFRNYNQSSSSKIVKDHYVWFLAPWFQKGSKKVPKRFQNSSKKVPNICSINVLPI